MQKYALIVLLILTTNPTHAAIQTKTVTYKAGDTECRGYLAWDDATEGPRPGVLVVHEWWGLNDYAKKRTEELAKLGYIAFAADIYGEGKTTTHPADAGKMAGEVRANVDAWRTRAQAALDVLKEQPQCDKEKLAAIGYCFGGATALQLAYAGADLDAVATFHGALPVATADEAKQIKAELQINHGADDPMIGADAVAAFKKPLDEAGVKYEFIAYPGAVHSFTVPTADEVGIPGIKYNKEADEKSWQAMQELFERKLGK
ncbi:MAG: dienelactone hydrolase family protein [Bythopirellula sp.]|nr:dienelactone hydrolase family protein [Bythopirellula sp.]